MKKSERSRLVEVRSRKFSLDGTVVGVEEPVTAESATQELGPVHEVPLPNGARVYFQRNAEVVNDPVSFAVKAMIGHPIRILGDAILVPPPL